MCLTSFSVLMARYKLSGDGGKRVKAVPAAGWGPVLISEGCTHHRQCNDIGTVR